MWFVQFTAVQNTAAKQGSSQKKQQVAGGVVS